MLIISNGAFKSGSTWIFNILKELTGFDSPPMPYSNPEWVNPTVPKGMLPEMLATLDIANQNYIFKSHYRDKQTKRLVVKNDNIRIFNIARDIKDVLVSAYFHDQRKHDFSGSFQRYISERGKNLAADILNFHKLWSPKHPNIYMASYENLHHHYTEEVHAIAAFLGIAVTAEEIKAIKNKTSIEALRNQYNDLERLKSVFGKDDINLRFFRKGTIGDWENYFDSSSKEAIVKIETRLNNLIHSYRTKNLI